MPLRDKLGKFRKITNDERIVTMTNGALGTLIGMTRDFARRDLLKELGILKY